MTVGEALAEARYLAGLTLDELSERTRIREAVIRCIEQDDYAACGGDLYVRGYVRAIAGAVGIDAQPLIREYDAGRAALAANSADSAASAVIAVAGGEPPTVIDMPPVSADSGYAAGQEPDPSGQLLAVADQRFPVADLESTIAGLESTIADPEFKIPDLAFADQEFTVSGPDLTDQCAIPLTAAPAAPAPVTRANHPQTPPPSVWRARIRGRRWLSGIAVLLVIALAVAGFAASHIVTHLRHRNAANEAAAHQHQQAGQGALGGKAKAAPGAANTGRTASAKPSATPKATPQAVPVHWLPIKLAMAFGPRGTADGDNPQVAQYAITHASSPWQTDWYASPRFGLLKSGTGLLLDMGKTVTISSVRIDLSPYRGADLQLRLGDAPELTDLRVAARAADVGGTVQLTPRSALRARYVLIWFTLLPPNGAGTYQEAVYRVVVDGRP